MSAVMGGRIMAEHLAAVGTAVTVSAATVDWLELLSGLSELLLTWVGIATGVVTLLWYLAKFRELRKMKKEKRHAAIQRELED